MSKGFTNLFSGKSRIRIEPEFDRFKKNVNRASDISPNSTVRGKWFLDIFDRAFRKLDTATGKVVPSDLNPFTQAGAVANVAFIIALVTGFLLLIWYRPSVFLAYDIVAALGESRYFGGMIRSLHRYSSDVFMLFVLFHGFKVFFAARFTGSRTLAWITGLIGIWLIWFDGWLGYWLVWDERGALVASASARFLDVVPLFAEPLAASFLTNDGFNSLLFFIVFFLHMLIPLAFGITLWLHVSRLNKPVFLVNRPFALLITISLIVLSIVYPADIESRADMLSSPGATTGDWFYLLPLFLTERLQGGVLWIVALGIFVFLSLMPWFFRRRNIMPHPDVVEKTCNGCTQCVQDCPYGAISMVPRTNGNLRKSEKVALIDPELCVSCGICVGSCDPVAIDYPGLSPWLIRDHIDQFLDLSSVDGMTVAFTCGNCAGNRLHIDSVTGHCNELPNFRVIAVPCAGWVHPALIERSLKKGADGVVILGCQSDPDFRLGSQWLDQRIKGERHPRLRSNSVEFEDILMMKLDPSQMDEFIETAKSFSKRKFLTHNLSSEHQEKQEKTRTKYGWREWAAACLVFAITLIITGYFSSATINLPSQPSGLTIYFKMKGSPIESHMQDNSALLEHMRNPDQTIVDRRSNVRLKVFLNGVEIHDSSHKPTGIRRRGYSNAMVKVPIEVGHHSMSICLGDQTIPTDVMHNLQSSVDPNGENEVVPVPGIKKCNEPWVRFEVGKSVEIRSDKKSVVIFDENHGFRFY